MKVQMVLIALIAGCASAPPTPMPKIAYTGDRNNAAKIGSHNFKVIDTCKEWAGLNEYTKTTGKDLVEASNSPDPVIFIPMVGSSIYQLKLSKKHRDATIAGAFFKDCVKANQVDQPPASVMHPQMSPEMQELMDRMRKLNQR